MPDPATMRALADGLGVDVSAVLTAASEAVGIHVEEVALPGDPSSRAIVAGLSRLTDDDRETVARMVASLARQTKK